MALRKGPGRKAVNQKVKICNSVLGSNTHRDTQPIKKTLKEKMGRSTRRNSIWVNFAIRRDAYSGGRLKESMVG